MRSTLYMSLLATLLASPLALAEARIERAFTETFTVGDEAELTIKNIWGDVTVVRGKPGEIRVAIEEDRRAFDQEALDYSLDVIPLRIDQTGDAVSLIVGRKREQYEQQWPCEDCRAAYQFVATVPPDTRVTLRAVNDGEIIVRDIEGLVSAKNVNGPVTVERLRQCDHIKSVNGEVYLGVPGRLPADCAVETVNGDIQVRVTPRSDFDVALTQMNGRVYTQVDVQPIAIDAAIETRQKGGRRHYKIRQPAGLRIGSGQGATLNIESLNGDVSIEEEERS